MDSRVHVDGICLMIRFLDKERLCCDLQVVLFELLDICWSMKCSYEVRQEDSGLVMYPRIYVRESYRSSLPFMVSPGVSSD